MKKTMKDKIIEVIENCYADDKGHYSFRNKTALRLVKENLNITYNDHWYTVKIYDETMKIYCNQKDFRWLEYFALACELNSCNFYWSYEDCPNKFSEDFPECVYWRIYWCDDKEYEDTLSDLYKDEDFVLYLTNTSAWYDKHNK